MCYILVLLVIIINLCKGRGKEIMKLKKGFKNVDNNEAASICAKCNGCCCRRFACQLIPTDIFGDEEPTLEKFLKFMSDDHYVVDWWDGDVRDGEFFATHPEEELLSVTYYVRPAHKGVMRKFDPSWGGECVFFVFDKGCSLSFENALMVGKFLFHKKIFIATMLTVSPKEI